MMKGFLSGHIDIRDTEFYLNSNLVRCTSLEVYLRNPAGEWQWVSCALLHDEEQYTCMPTTQARENDSWLEKSYVLRKMQWARIALDLLPTNNRMLKNSSVRVLPGLHIVMYRTNALKEDNFTTQLEEQLKRQLYATVTVQTYGDLQDNALEQTDVLLLLLSPSVPESFFASSLLQQALKKQEQGTLCIIPLLVRPMFWMQLPIAHLRLLPGSERDGVKPYSLLLNPEIAFDLIIKDIAEIAEQFVRELIAPLSNIVSLLSSEERRDRTPEERRGLGEQIFSITERMKRFYPEAMAYVFFQMGEVFYQEGGKKDFIVAQRYYEQNLDLCTHIFGSESPEVVRCLRRLGSISQNQGDHTKAEGYFKRMVFALPHVSEEPVDLVLAVILSESITHIVCMKLPQNLRFYLKTMTDFLGDPFASCISRDKDVHYPSSLWGWLQQADVDALCLLDTNEQVTFVVLENQMKNAAEYRQVLHTKLSLCLDVFTLDDEDLPPYNTLN